MPEFIAPQDGAENQDCERNAAKRWLSAHAERVRALRPVYLGDALFGSQPMAEAVLAAGADFLFVCKKDSHKTLYEYVQGAPLGECSVTEHKPGGRTRTYRYRWIEGVPLRDGKEAMSVNWLGVRILDAGGKTVYEGAFVTSLSVVAEIAACSPSPSTPRATAWKRSGNKPARPWPHVQDSSETSMPSAPTSSSNHGKAS